MVGNYLAESVNAVNQRDFTIVEPLIDPNGKKYKEQRDYNQYLEKKNITEELLNFEIKDIVQVDQESYKVTTYEEYRIVYEDYSEKIKSFNSSYRVKALADGQLTINELLYLKEQSSQ